MTIFEHHPHDSRRAASVVCMENGSSVALYDQQETVLAAAMVRARMGWDKP